MILIDTSVWVDFLRQGDEHLAYLLSQNNVCIHPMVMGELACGHLHQREQLFKLWKKLPQLAEATHQEAIFLLTRHQLMGKGIGFIDLHLLAATKLSANTQLWTKDKRLQQTANTLNIGYMLQ